MMDINPTSCIGFLHNHRGVCPQDPAGHGPAVHARLDRCALLQCELELLRGMARKENQMNGRVELNLEIKRLEGVLDAVNRSLREGIAS